jgi:hypothetical protein
MALTILIANVFAKVSKKSEFITLFRKDTVVGSEK